MNEMFTRPPTFVLKGDRKTIHKVWPEHKLV